MLILKKIFTCIKCCKDTVKEWNICIFSKDRKHARNFNFLCKKSSVIKYNKILKWISISFLLLLRNFQHYFRSLLVLVNEENGAIIQWKLVKSNLNNIKNCSRFSFIWKLMSNWLVSIWRIWKVYSLWCGVQLAYGSPSKPSMQEHIGWWFCVVHRALNPHEPMHGSWHCWEIQARLDGHSWWITHSGRQFGGVPNIPNEHEQTGRPSITWHSEFGPQAPDRHGFGCSLAIQPNFNL